jgi:hypothetical protein
MALATVFLAPMDTQLSFYREDPLAVVEWLIKGDKYQKIGTIQTLAEGEAAAEEMFDLSNNPSRDRERQIKWGANRSLSVGDAVNVDGTTWVCLPMGWQQA